MGQALLPKTFARRSRPSFFLQSLSLLASPNLAIWKNFEIWSCCGVMPSWGPPFLCLPNSVNLVIPQFRQNQPGLPPLPTFYTGHREFVPAKQNRCANVTKFSSARALNLELPGQRFISQSHAGRSTPSLLAPRVRRVQFRRFRARGTAPDEAPFPQAAVRFDPAARPWETGPRTAAR